MNGLSALITKIQYFSITIAIIGIALIVARYFFQRQTENLIISPLRV